MKPPVLAPGVVAVITARKGSKGLPGKNKHPFLGEPLIVRTLAAARDCPLVDRYVVTTDDDDIAALAAAWGAEVVIRPAELAGDAAGSADAVRHALDQLATVKPPPENLVLLQPTSPLRTAVHLTRCLEMFLPSAAAACVSVTEMEHHPRKSLTLDEHGRLTPLFDAADLETPRQQLPAAFRPNGAIYAIRTAIFLAQNRFFAPPVTPFVMTAMESCDIDTLFDLKIAEMLAGEGK